MQCLCLKRSSRSNSSSRPILCKYSRLRILLGAALPVGGIRRELVLCRRCLPDPFRTHAETMRPDAVDILPCTSAARPHITISSCMCLKLFVTRSACYRTAARQSAPIVITYALYVRSPAVNKSAGNKSSFPPVCPRTEDKTLELDRQ
jgi:hypothetical protein